MTDDKTPDRPDELADGAGRDPAATPSPQDGDLAKAARAFWAALLRALGRGGRGLGQAGTRAFGQGRVAAQSLSQRAARGTSAGLAAAQDRLRAHRVETESDPDVAQAEPRPPITQRAVQGWRAASARRRARLDARKLRPAATVRASRWIWRTVFGLAFLLLLGIVLAGGILVWAVRDLPLAEMLPPLEEPTLTVQDEDGDTLFTRGAYRAGYVAYDEVARYLTEKTTTTEAR